MQTESDPKSCQNAKGVQKVAKKDKNIKKDAKEAKQVAEKMPKLQTEFFSPRLNVSLGHSSHSHHTTDQFSKYNAFALT